MTRSFLAGQAAVVAGATSDIGRAICAGLASAGVRLHLLGRDADALDRLGNDMQRLGEDVRAHRIDLTDDLAVRELCDGLRRDPGAVGILVHSAGIFEMGPHETAAVDDLDRQYRANVRGPYLLTQGLLPHLRAGRGQVVFVNSTVGLAARAGVGQYASTQHALRAIADSLRAEVNADGVRVLSVYLGRTATARQARIFRQEGRDYAPELLIQPADVAAMILATLDLPRTAEVTEIRMRPLVKSY